MGLSSRTVLSLLAAVAWLGIGPIAAGVAQGPPAPEPQPSTQPTTPNLVNPSDSDVEAITKPKNPWRAEASLWIWAMGMDGDLGVRGRSVTVDATMIDIIEESDSLFAFSGRLELGYGKVAGFIDGLYCNVGADDETGPLGVADVDLDVEETLVDFGLMYRLGDWEGSGDAALNPRHLTLDLYAGARYTDLEIETRPTLLPTFTQSSDWFDPIIGMKVVVPVGEHWHFAINGDVGGFGVEADLTWSATAVVGYDFHIAKLPASVLFGYRAVGWDYSAESGPNEFTWQMIQHGLLLGFSLQF